MTDLSTQVLPELMDYQLPGINSSDDLLFPRYSGYSLANIPSTVCKLLNIPEFGEGPLAPNLFAELGGPYKRVILLVVDALGYRLLNHLMINGKAEFWRESLADGVLMPLTSICPSTTASALTTLWTGVSPATHGIIGYEMWVKEFSMVINNISHSAMSYAGDTGGLRRAGFDPNTFLERPLLGTHLHKHGVNPYAFMHSSISSSGLSTMHLSDVSLHGYICESDMWVSMRNKLNAEPNEHMFVYAYWSTVDTLSHRFSKDDERIALQFENFSSMIQKGFINDLSKEARKDTLLLMTADHGSVFTPQCSEFNLVDHPDLYAMLRIQPTCENRFAFLFVRPGMIKAVQDYFYATWPGKFTLIKSDQAVEAGLFGLGPFTETLFDRVGDLIAVAHEDAYLWWAKKTNLMLGRHGGLNPDEMLIPLFALPL